VCKYCGEAIEQHSTKKYDRYTSTRYCNKCAEFSFKPTTDILASIVYDDFSKRFILRFKSKNDPAMALTFARMFHRQDFDGVDVIIPVPIHPLRLWSRTYNQSALLALGIRRWHDDMPPVKLNVLRKVRYRNKQKGRSAAERTANTVDSIIVNKTMESFISGKSVAVIDDVVASGATFEECQRALYKSGAKSVRCIALAQVL
jgi:ComF family protein